MRALVVFALVTGCRASGSFACGDDDDCAGVAGGACEASGFCSFPDEECESGRRYGEWAGGDLAMSCVPVDVASGSTSTDSEEGGTVVTLTSSDPTTLTTSATLTATSVEETTSPIDPDTSTSMAPPTSGDDSATTGEPLDPDLVAWYRFEQDDFEGGVIDEVGLHDGTCVDSQCPVVIEGVDGKAAQFDGLDDIVHVALSDLLVIDTAITVTLWVRLDVADGEFKTFAAKAYADRIDDTWELGLGSTDIEFILTTSAGVVEAAGGVPPVDTWIHAAGVWDGEAIRFYVDGAFIEEAVATDILQDEHAITLGAGIDFGAEENFLDGALDEVRIYRRALVDDEIAALAVVP